MIYPCENPKSDNLKPRRMRIDRIIGGVGGVSNISTHGPIDRQARAIEKKTIQTYRQKLIGEMRG